MEENDNLTLKYIKGQLILSNGEEVSFTIDEEGFSQWGLEKEKLGFTQHVMEALSNAFAEQAHIIEESYRNDDEKD